MYYNAETNEQYDDLEQLLCGKIVNNITKVEADCGFTITFNDGTKLQVVFSSGEGFIGVNDIEI